VCANNHCNNQLRQSHCTATQLNDWIDIHLPPLIHQTQSRLSASNALITIFTQLTAACGIRTRTGTHTHTCPVTLSLRFHRAVHSLFFCNMPSAFPEMLFHLFNQHFGRFHDATSGNKKGHGSNANTDTPRTDKGTNLNHSNEEKIFRQLCSDLLHLKWQQISEQIYSEVLFRRIETHIHCVSQAHTFEQHVLSKVSITL